MTEILAKFPRRRNSLRLEKADYCQPGAYFITITTNQREPIFGSILDGKMICSRSGDLVWEVWGSLPLNYPDISIDAAVVMPDHFHGIIIIHDSIEATHRDMRAGVNSPEGKVGAIHESPLLRRRMTIPLIIGYFKMTSAKKINVLRGRPGGKVWQRGYFDHILRDDKDYDALTEYILMNPYNWLLDKE